MIYLWCAESAKRPAKQDLSASFDSNMVSVPPKILTYSELLLIRCNIALYAALPRLGEHRCKTILNWKRSGENTSRGLLCLPMMIRDLVLQRMAVYQCFILHLNPISNPPSKQVEMSIHAMEYVILNYNERCMWVSAWMRFFRRIIWNPRNLNQILNQILQASERVLLVDAMHPPTSPLGQYEGPPLGWQEGNFLGFS